MKKSKVIRKQTENTHLVQTRKVLARTGLYSPSVVSTNTPHTDLLNLLRVHNRHCVRIYQTELIIVQLHYEFSTLEMVFFTLSYSLAQRFKKRCD